MTLSISAFVDSVKPLVVAAHDGMREEVNRLIEALGQCDKISGRVDVGGILSISAMISDAAVAMQRLQGLLELLEAPPAGVGVIAFVRLAIAETFPLFRFVEFSTILNSVIDAVGSFVEAHPECEPSRREWRKIYAGSRK